MRAKRPLLVGVLILALLAVALVLPATASGTNGKQPLAWVSLAGKNFPDEDPIPDGGRINLQRVLVQWYGGDEISGKLTLQTVHPLDQRMIATAHDFEYVAHSDDEFTFAALLDLYFPGDVSVLDVPVTCTYHDGGGPGPEGDWFLIDGGWLIIGGPIQLGNGNIVVHNNQ